MTHPEHAQPEQQVPHGRSSCLIPIIVIAILAAAFLQITSFVEKGPAVPLLTQAEDLIQTRTVLGLSKHTSLEVPFLPEEAGTIVVAGYYPSGSQTFLPESVSIVTKKGDHRFVEMTIQPHADRDLVVSQFGLSTAEEVVLQDTPNTIGILGTIHRPFYNCIEPEDDLPGFCQIQHVLIFSWNETVISLASDAQGASSGELLTLARSIMTP